MILLVAITFPPCTGIASGAGTSVAEVDREFKEVVEEVVKAVEPVSCDDRELWLIV